MNHYLNIKNWKLKIRLTRKGFSFLELMTVIAMVGIMTAVTLVSLNKSRSEKDVEVAARVVAGALHEAQNYALTGENASSSCGGMYWFKYKITGDSDYEISGCLSAKYTLPKNITFNEVGSIYFTTPHADIYGADGNLLFAQDPYKTAGYLDITLKKDSSEYHVCLYPAGDIKEKKDGC